jgi:hypothetical protein
MHVAMNATAENAILGDILVAAFRLKIENTKYTLTKGHLISGPTSVRRVERSGKTVLRKE